MFSILEFWDKNHETNACERLHLVKSYFQKADNGSL